MPRFIPTASSDSELYWEHIQKYFDKFLQCKTDALLLMRDRLSMRQIQEKIQNADFIYVGGGNTLHMMHLWRRLGVDKLLGQAYRKGAVLSGSVPGRSAGLIPGILIPCRFITRGIGNT